jgi:hypothetical protein
VRLLPKISIDFCLFIRPNVRYGSLADVETRVRDVCFAPESGRTDWRAERPLNCQCRDAALRDVDAPLLHIASGPCHPLPPPRGQQEGELTHRFLDAAASTFPDVGRSLLLFVCGGGRNGDRLDLACSRPRRRRLRFRHRARWVWWRSLFTVRVL